MLVDQFSLLEYTKKYNTKGFQMSKWMAIVPAVFTWFSIWLGLFIVLSMGFDLTGSLIRGVPAIVALFPAWLVWKHFNALDLKVI
jgi:hypothetical protein